MRTQSTRPLRRTPRPPRKDLSLDLQIESLGIDSISFSLYSQIDPPRISRGNALNTVFTDLPRPIERDEYTRCQEAACEIVHSHPDCIGLYGAGEVRYPGLSDLDLVIVLAEGSSIRPILQGQNLPEPGPYLANHSFPHYPPEIFRWLHYLFPLFSPLQPLVEKEPIDLEPSPQNPDDAKQLAAFYVADYLVKKIYHLLDYTDGRPVPVRQLLCHLHTIRYTLSCLEQATGTAIG
ncbi:MAG: hypothetical protein QF752_05545, partial [Planctomycetota bacterium]|nr:hypothetical protein [Planctomycetota bacterium]